MGRRPIAVIQFGQHPDGPLPGDVPGSINAVSLFSGAGGLDLGFERAGITPVAGCEKDRFARAVWRRHHPNVPVHDNVEDFDADWITAHAVPRIHVVGGGSPCTDLSVAGRRGGLAGDASRLFWHQCRIAALVAAPWVVWENVPDALSSNEGADFAAVLFGLTGHLPEVPANGWRPWGVCWSDQHVVVWRVLDAQWFGVAQRRRRLFAVRGPRTVASQVVGVLLDAEGLSGSPRPSRPPEPGAPGAAEDRAGVGRPVGYLTAHHARLDDQGAGSGQLVAGALTGQVLPSSDNPAGSLIYDLAQATSAENRSNPKVGDPAPTMTSTGNPVVAGALTAHHGGFDDNEAQAGNLISFAPQVGGTRETVIHDLPGRTCALIASQNLAISDGHIVRRLTETERERLMGWPDDWTAWGIDDHGIRIEISETQRRRQTGNGVVAPVAEFIGHRLAAAIRAHQEADRPLLAPPDMTPGAQVPPPGMESGGGTTGR